MEGGIQVWVLGSHGFSPNGIDWLEKRVSPSCDRQFAAGFNHTPKFSNHCFHIRDKENTEYADDRVKMLVRKSKIGHIAQTKLYIMDLPLCRFYPCLTKQLLC